MASSKFGEFKMEVRKVAQEVLLLNWRKQSIISDKPDLKSTFPPEITEKFLNDLYLLLWIESFIRGEVWKGFLNKHFNRMVRTPYLFANYVAFASYLSIENASNEQERFIGIFSLVNHFTSHCWGQHNGKFLNMSLELFCQLFDKDHCTKFVKEGSWKKLSEHLKDHESLKDFKVQKQNDFFGKLSAELKTEKPREINGIVLEDVTEEQVENDKKSVRFAESVGDIMKKLYKMEFEDVLKDFEKTDCPLEKLSSETEANNTLARDEDQSLQEDKDDSLKNIPSLMTTEEIEHQTIGGDPDPLPNKGIESLNSPGSAPELDQIPKADRMKVTKLLAEMTKDIVKMSELIKFVCEENGITAPIKVVTDTNKF